jgi:molybdate transport system ATP-binding protein
MLQVNVKKHLGERGRGGFQLDVSFELGPGITVISGHSGSGKTSTLRLIAGILTPDEGRIANGPQIYFDSDKKINVSIQQRRTGFVFQDYALFPHLTAQQNIAYGVRSAENGSKVSELLELFHIEHVAKRLPRDMSGGEQQRVAIARALASDPAIMLLDEPLSAVDVETRLKLLDEIEMAQRRTNIPFVYVTHNRAEAERLATRRIDLENGKVAQTAG